MRSENTVRSAIVPYQRLNFLSFWGGVYLKMSVPNLIACFLEISILALFQMLVKLFGICAVLDANIDDFLRCLCICKIKCWATVELDILGRVMLSNIEHSA